MSGELRFLIAGTARSGTTLVQRMCAELPGVWVPAETHFWSLAEEASTLFEFPLRSRNRADMVDWMLDRLGNRIPDVSRATVLDEIAAREQRVGLWVVFESLVAAMSPPSTPVLGEKTPAHLGFWEQLTSDVPGLGLVCVVRDPRAVLASQRRVEWGESDPWALAERWVHHQRAVRDASRLRPDRTLVLRYEDIVASPADTQRTLAEHLGVPDEPQPLDESVVREHPLFPAREEWKTGALAAITTEATATWRNRLEPEAIAIVEHVAADEMAAFGYEIEADTDVPVIDDASRAAVTAFRTWWHSMAATSSLPIT